MRRSATLLTAAIALCLGAISAPARAGSVRIDFDFSGSSLSVLGGLINVPPDGNINAATGQIAVQSAGVSSLAAPGAAALRSFNLNATVNANTLGLVITGPASAALLSPVPGALTAGLGNLILNPGNLSLNAFVNCSGTGCATLGFPLSVTGPQPVNFATLPINNINSIGNATIAGLFSMTIGGFTAVLSLVGTEVSRTYIPEPGSFGLVALGLVGLASAGAARRRRHC